MGCDMDASLLRLLAGVSLLLTVACGESEPSNPVSSSTPPLAVPPAAPRVTMSGTVWIHDAGGVRRDANSTIFGWVQQPTHGYSTGPMPTDANGRFSFAVPQGAQVRLQNTVREGFQPCQVVIRADTDVAADIHVVVDRQQLGARIPAELRARTPTLSGLVFERATDGRLTPLADAYISVDGLNGGDWLSATTLTDAEGRYIVCGLTDEPSTYLYASKSGYRPFESSVNLAANTSLDIELHR